MLKDFSITAYCLIDKTLKNFPGAQKLRQRGFQPNLSDSEVILMEIVAEFLGIDTDKGTWEYFIHHWHDWFPALNSRDNYAKQAANLWNVTERVQAWPATHMGRFLTDYI